MEVFPRRLISLEQMSLNNAMGCELDLKTREHAVMHQPAPSPRGLICPEPRRAARAAPFIVDSLNRICCNPKINLPTHRGDCSLDIFNIFLTKDHLEDDLDASNSQKGFFCGSPPVRTNNPLIHDVQFVRQTSTLASPTGNSHGGNASSPRLDRGSSCAASSFGRKPMVRIEGFACGNSESHCIVPALA